MKGFGGWEIAVVAVYFAAVLFGGWFVSRRRAGVEDFFVGGRAVPWPAVFLSITATESISVSVLWDRWNG